MKSREVTILGKGTGECIVIHLGNDKWFIVDSFINNNTKNPAALDYLESISIPTDNVVGVLATHWHCDHIMGIDRIIEVCDNADFYFTQALTSEEAEVFYNTMKSSASLGMKTYTETINKVIELMQKRDRISRALSIKERMSLWDDRENRTRLTALSPSEEAAQQSIAHLKKITPAHNEIRRIKSLPSDPNLNAVALHLEFGGDCTILLGSDLEVNENDKTGWKAVLSSGIYDKLCLSRAAIYKVPHHGSETGYHKDIWDDLLEEKPITATTCFSKSHLPREDQVERILGLSDKFYLTSKPNLRPKKRAQDVEKKINMVAKNRRSVSKDTGRVTIFIDDTGEVNIELEEPAHLVKLN